MSLDLQNAIDSLNSELQTINLRAVEIKKTINNLSALMGKEQPYNDAELSTFSNSINIRPDQFFGKGLATAVKEYLKIKGRAVPLQEIYDALKAGGYEFTGSRVENIQMRNLAISLGKNTNDFIYVKSSNSYGLLEFYPEKMKERKKNKETNPKDREEEKEDYTLPNLGVAQVPSI